MKISSIAETKLSRRSFLRNAAGTLSALSPLGRLLSIFDIPQETIRSGFVNLAISLPNTIYDPNKLIYMKDYINHLNRIESFVRQQDGVIDQIGNDANLMAIGKIPIQKLALILRSVDPESGEGEVQIDGNIYNIFDEGESFFLENTDKSGSSIGVDNFKIYKGSIPKYLEASPIQQNLSKAWLNYTKDSSFRGIVDKEMLDIMKDEGERPSRKDHVEQNEEELIDKNRSNEQWSGEYHGSMHQYFESIEKILKRYI